MCERLLGAGADISSVYFCDDGGTVCHVLGGSVFHWEDLTGRDADVIENDGGWRAADVARAAGVSLSDLLAAWRLVQHFGGLIGEPVQRVAMCCPSCGGDDIAEDGSEDCEPGTVERWCMCHTCDATWTDTYVIGSRTVLTSGKSAPVVSTPGGVADWLDMAYEDRNGCGVES